MAELFLQAGGRLFETNWVYPSEPNQEREFLKDVTTRAAFYLMEPVDLDENLTLLDLFKLLRDNELLQVIFDRDYASAYVKEAFKLEALPLAGQQGGHELEYLELYHSWPKNSKTKELDVRRLNFTGFSPVLLEDHVEDGLLMGKKGTRIEYGIGFRPVKELLNLPLRYNPEVSLVEACSDDINKLDTDLEKVFVYSPLLGQVIQGVLYELSFEGSPEESEAFFNQVTGMGAEAKKSLDPGSPPEPDGD